MKSHKVYTTSSRRGWKEPQQGLCWWLDLGCGKGELQLWTPQWTICDVMVLGGEGALENRPECIRTQRQFICATSLRDAHVCIPQVLYYSWKATAFWLRKKLWMNPDSLHTLQIVILLHRLHLNKRDLNVANVF